MKIVLKPEEEIILTAKDLAGAQGPVPLLKFDDQGLIPAIIQDYKTKDVLMMAFMNLESIKRTIQEGKTCFWSRSRREYWIKGMTSGHFQFVKSIYYDCDGDCLLIKVRQVGAACHTMKRSCFYRKVKL